MPQRPDIVFNPASTAIAELLPHMPALARGYAPPPFLPSGTLQVW